MRFGHHGLPCFNCSEEVSEYLKTTGAFRAPYHPDPKLFGWTFTGLPSLRPALPWVQGSSTGMVSCLLCLKKCELRSHCSPRRPTYYLYSEFHYYNDYSYYYEHYCCFLLLLLLWLMLLVLLLLSVKSLLFRLLVLLLFLLLLVLSKLQPSTSPENVRSSSRYSRMTQCQVVDQNLLAVKGMEVWGVGFTV